MMNIIAPDEKRSSRVWLRRVHYVSGILLTTFVGVHLLNHLLGGISPATHIAFMAAARLVYRNPLVESALLSAVMLQIVTGLRLAKLVWQINEPAWTRLHVGSGLYLAVFLVIHVSSVMAGRLVWQLDTNFYFGVAGLNHYPQQLFFIPYYSLAILSFFAHLAAIHRVKMTQTVAAMSPLRQAQVILLWG